MLNAEIKWKQDTYFIQTLAVLPSSLVNSIFWAPKLIMPYFCTFIVCFSTVFERKYAIIWWFCCWSYECWKTLIWSNIYWLLLDVRLLRRIYDKLLSSSFLLHKYLSITAIFPFLIMEIITSIRFYAKLWRLYALNEIWFSL